jgi:hypothetical protein
MFVLSFSYRGWSLIVKEQSADKGARSDLKSTQNGDTVASCLPYGRPFPWVRGAHKKTQFPRRET